MTTEPTVPPAPGVLVVDDDRDIAELVEAILSDAGYTVSLLYQLDPETVTAAVGRLEPDCVLLDSSDSRDYGDSWTLAQRFAERERPVPVVMFTANAAANQEARTNVSDRSQAARFAGVLAKPFDLEEVLAVVAHATGTSSPFDLSMQADAVRTQALVERLQTGGATDLRRSTRREWITFRAPSGRLVQLYWWQQGGCLPLRRLRGGDRGDAADRARRRAGGRRRLRPLRVSVIPPRRGKAMSWLRPQPSG
jgi:CheY-like chemotaxis protein